MHLQNNKNLHRIIFYRNAGYSIFKKMLRWLLAIPFCCLVAKQVKASLLFKNSLLKEDATQNISNDSATKLFSNSFLSSYPFSTSFLVRVPSLSVTRRHYHIGLNPFLFILVPIPLSCHCSHGSHQQQVYL